MSLSELIKARETSALQVGLGMMRVAELQAIATVAQHINAKAYVSIGCGQGYDFLLLRENYRSVPALGFDVCAVSPDNVYPEVEFHREGIFQSDRYVFHPHVHDKIRSFLGKNPGPALFYTDNGLKIDELRELIPHVKADDVMGTHDWGIDPLTPVGTYAEVLEHACGFLYDAGFKVFEPVESWIKSHKCLQRFWIKA